MLDYRLLSAVKHKMSSGGESHDPYAGSIDPVFFSTGADRNDGPPEVIKGIRVMVLPESKVLEKEIRDPGGTVIQHEGGESFFCQSVSHLRSLNGL